ncbi:LysR family transcriptional regulator [Aerococcus agrisoli]|uniref:LysR family transcriptional regulator n=1 Tax=Aerococcus agrisoli TaxID=2487350 RepID=A0A3N4GNE9_9LACT|nr:LysR family transcriptional regulator [Aerococcus agrisoli]RPA63685.1 LysR family transcriptional regulator [Aerococcus agrisoli]
MNIEQLANIVEVAKTKSFTKAANHRNVTLPTLSLSVSNLEKEFEIKIFHRSHSETVPTKEGLVIIEIAKEIIEKIENLNESVQILKDDLNGTIRLASLPGFMSLIMDSVANLNGDYPSIQLNLFEGNSNQIYDQIRNQESDFAIIAFNDQEIRANKELIFEKIVAGKMVIVVNKQSPLANREAVTLADIQNEPIAMHDDVKLKEIFSEYEQMNITLLTNNVDSIRKTLVNNTAITIGLDYSFKTDPFFYESKDLVLVDLIKPHQVQNYIGIARLKNARFSEMDRIAVNYMKEAFQKCLAANS